MLILDLPADSILRIALPLGLFPLKLLSLTCKAFLAIAKDTRKMQLDKVQRTYTYLHFHAFPPDISSHWGNNRVIENMRGICPFMQNYGVYQFPPALDIQIEQDPSLEDVHLTPFLLMDDKFAMLEEMFEEEERPITECIVMNRPERKLTFVLGDRFWGVDQTTGGVWQFCQIEQLEGLTLSKMCLCNNVFMFVGDKRVFCLHAGIGFWRGCFDVPVELQLTPSNYMVLDMNENVYILSEMSSANSTRMILSKFEPSFCCHKLTKWRGVEQLGKVPPRDILGFQAIPWKDENILVFLPPQDDWDKGMYMVTMSEVYGKPYAFWCHHHFAKNIQRVHQVTPSLEGIRSMIWNSEEGLSLIVQGGGMWTVQERSGARDVRYRVRAASTSEEDVKEEGEAAGEGETAPAEP